MKILMFLVSMAFTICFLYAPTYADVPPDFNPPYHSKPTYVIQSGDTLSSIAKQVYGDETKWRQVWEMNPQIENPNLIYPGQLISLDPAIKILTKPKPIVKVVTPEEFEEKITKLMFKEVGIKHEPELDLIIRTRVRTENIYSYSRMHNYYRARTIIPPLHPDFLGLEIYELAKVLTDVYRQDKDMACLLTALAWQETGFHNRRGKSGEVGFYQVLPSTIKSIYGEESLLDAKTKMEENPKFATDFTIWYLTFLKKEFKNLETALYRYNGHPSYAPCVLHKLGKVKLEIQKE